MLEDKMHENWNSLMQGLKPDIVREISVQLTICPDSNAKEALIDMYNKFKDKDYFEKIVWKFKEIEGKRIKVQYPIDTMIAYKDHQAAEIVLDQIGISGKKDWLIDFNAVFTDKDTMNVLNKYSHYIRIAFKAASNLSQHDCPDYTLDLVRKLKSDYIIETINEFDRNVQALLIDMNFVDAETLQNGIYIFQNYGNHGEFCSAIYDIGIKAFQYDQFKSKMAKEAVKADPSVIWKIGSKDYSRLRHSIGYKLGERIGYKDLFLVESTYEMVREIHEARNHLAMNKIRRSFYMELNRAIRQGVDDKDKLRNVRRYCHEVQKKMRENASELMVVHNE